MEEFDIELYEQSIFMENQEVEILLDIATKLDWIFVGVIAVIGVLLVQLFFTGKGDK